MPWPSPSAILVLALFGVAVVADPLPTTTEYAPTGKLSQFRGYVSPRPAGSVPNNANFMYASVWAAWSAWSFCVNGQRIRVRACNTVKGFSCLGTNREQEPCAANAPNMNNPRRHMNSDYDVVDPWEADRMEAMRQLYSSDEEEEGQQNSKEYYDDDMKKTGANDNFMNLKGDFRARAAGVHTVSDLHPPPYGHPQMRGAVTHELKNFERQPNRDAGMPALPNRVFGAKQLEAKKSKEFGIPVDELSDFEDDGEELPQPSSSEVYHAPGTSGQAPGTAGQHTVGAHPPGTVTEPREVEHIPNSMRPRTHEGAQIKEMKEEEAENTEGSEVSSIQIRNEGTRFLKVASPGVRTTHQVPMVRPSTTTPQPTTKKYAPVRVHPVSSEETSTSSEERVNPVNGVSDSVVNEFFNEFSETKAPKKEVYKPRTLTKEQLLELPDDSFEQLPQGPPTISPQPPLKVFSRPTTMNPTNFKVFHTRKPQRVTPPPAPEDPEYFDFEPHKLMMNSEKEGTLAKAEEDPSVAVSSPYSVPVPANAGRPGHASRPSDAAGPAEVSKSREDVLGHPPGTNSKILETQNEDDGLAGPVFPSKPIGFRPRTRPATIQQQQMQEHQHHHQLQQQHQHQQQQQDMLVQPERHLEQQQDHMNAKANFGRVKFHTNPAARENVQPTQKENMEEVEVAETTTTAPPLIEMPLEQPVPQEQEKKPVPVNPFATGANVEVFQAKQRVFPKQRPQHDNAVKTPKTRSLDPDYTFLNTKVYGDADPDQPEPERKKTRSFGITGFSLKRKQKVLHSGERDPEEQQHAESRRPNHQAASLLNVFPEAPKSTQPQQSQQQDYQQQPQQFTAPIDEDEPYHPQSRSSGGGGSGKEAKLASSGYESGPPIQKMIEPVNGPMPDISEDTAKALDWMLNNITKMAEMGDEQFLNQLANEEVNKHPSLVPAGDQRGGHGKFPQPSSQPSSLISKGYDLTEVAPARVSRPGISKQKPPGSIGTANTKNMGWTNPPEHSGEFHPHVDSFSSAGISKRKHPPMSTSIDRTSGSIFNEPPPPAPPVHPVAKFQKGNGIAKANKPKKMRKKNKKNNGFYGYDGFGFSQRSAKSRAHASETMQIDKDMGGVIDPSAYSPAQQGLIEEINHLQDMMKEMDKSIDSITPIGSMEGPISMGEMPFRDTQPSTEIQKASDLSDEPVRKMENDGMLKSMVSIMEVPETHSGPIVPMSAMDLELAPRNGFVPNRGQTDVIERDPREPVIVAQSSIVADASEPYWNEWTTWGSCFCGKQVRTRTCNYIEGLSANGCLGASFESRECEGGRCPTKRPNHFTIQPAQEEAALDEFTLAPANIRTDRKFFKMHALSAAQQVN